MKNHFAIIILLLWSPITYAQKTETFDIATYKIPTGWKKSNKQGVVTYSITNEAKKIYCAINIYASIATHGTAEEEFDKQWNQLAAEPFAITDAPQKDTATDDEGRQVITGAGGFTKGSLSGIAMLTSYVGFGKTTCILILTNDETYYKNIEEFLSALNIANTPPAKSPGVSSDIVKPKTSGKENTFGNINKLDGVWNGININQNTTAYGFNHLSSNTPIWITFFDNGRVYSLLPDDLNSFNKNAVDIGYYKISNGAASLQWFKGTDEAKIEFVDNNRIVVHAATGDQTYGRCKPVDGIKLNGAWTTFANTNDAELDAPGVKPQIHFSKDGRFTDDGIFMTLLNETKTAPGSGTYSLNNFMLTLAYDNGTKRQTSFTGFFSNDVRIINNILYIDRRKFRKR